MLVKTFQTTISTCIPWNVLEEWVHSENNFRLPLKYIYIWRAGMRTIKLDLCSGYRNLQKGSFASMAPTMVKSGFLYYNLTNHLARCWWVLLLEAREASPVPSQLNEKVIQPNNPKLLLIFNFRKSLYFYYMYMQLVIKEGITATFLNHIPRNLKKTSYFVALWKLFLNHLHIIPVKFGLKWENFISVNQRLLCPWKSYWKSNQNEMRNLIWERIGNSYISAKQKSLCPIAVILDAGSERNWVEGEPFWEPITDHFSVYWSNGSVLTAKKIKMWSVWMDSRQLMTKAHKGFEWVIKNINWHTQELIDCAIIYILTQTEKQQMIFAYITSIMWLINLVLKHDLLSSCQGC